MIVKINHRGSVRGFQSGEELQGLRHNAVPLRAIGMGGRVVPQFPNLMVDSDDIIVAYDNVGGGDRVVPTLGKDGMG